MKKILGLDIGDARIGVAIAKKKLVAPYGVVSGLNLQAAIAEIAKICRGEQIQEIIIGVPQNRQEKDTFQIDKIHSFARELSKNIQIPIIYIDETLTSKEAERLLARSQDKKTKKFKEEVDKLSAELILGQYLEKSHKV